MLAHAILILILKASSDGSDDPVHPRGIVRAFAACIHNVRV